MDSLIFVANLCWGLFVF